MADLRQILLNKGQCGGRGVRVRTLSLTTVQKIRESAALGLGKDATMWQLENAVAKEHIVAMVAGVTESGGFKTPKELVGATWKKLTPLDFEDGAAEKYFAMPDIDALLKIFERLHTVKPSEVEDMLGEAQLVTED